MTTKIPDLVIGYNNSVAAAYVTAPDILVRDDRQLLKAPFLFYVSQDQSPSNIKSARDGGKAPYLSAQQFRTLLDNVDAVYGALWIPLSVPVLDESRTPQHLHTYPKEIVMPGRGGRRIPMGELASGYVPYSFGAGHDNDVKTGLKVRGDADYDRMIQEILPAVREERRHPVRTFFRRMRGGLESRM